MLYDNSMYRRSTRIDRKCIQYNSIDTYNGCTEQQVYSVLSPTRTDYIYIPPPTTKPPNYQIYSPISEPVTRKPVSTMTPFRLKKTNVKNLNTK